MCRSKVMAWSSFAKELCETAQPVDTNKFLKFILVCVPRLKKKGGDLLASQACTQGANGQALKESSPRKGRASVMSNTKFNNWQIAQIPEKFF